LSFRDEAKSQVREILSPCVAANRRPAPKARALFYPWESTQATKSSQSAWSANCPEMRLSFLPTTWDQLLMAGAAPTPTRRANLLPACVQNHRPSKVRAYKKGLARRLTGESPASRATSKVWPTNKPSAVRATVRVAAVTRGAGAGASVHPSQIEPTPGLAAAI